MDFLVHHLLQSSAQRTPDREAVVDGRRRYSYAKLAQLVDSLAAALVDLGVDRFDRIGVHLPTSVEQVIGLLASSSAGGVFVPIHASLFPRQVAHIARDCQLSVFITQSSHWHRLSAAQEVLPNLQHVILTDVVDPTSTDGPPTIHSLDTLVAAQLRPAAHVNVDRDLAAILYTSGSTGLPKGVMLSHANVVAGSSIVSDYLSISQRDRILAVLPFSFDAGLNQMTTALQQGAALVLASFVLAKQIVQRLISEQITGLAGVPTLWNLVAQSESFRAAHFPDLRYITNTGGCAVAGHLDGAAQRIAHNRSLSDVRLDRSVSFHVFASRRIRSPPQIHRKGDSQHRDYGG